MKYESKFRSLMYELNRLDYEYFQEVEGIGVKVINDFNLNNDAWSEFLHSFAGRFGNDILMKQPLTPEQLIGHLVADYNGVDSVNDLCLLLKRGDLVVRTIDSFPSYARLIQQGLVNTVELFDYQGQHKEIKLEKTGTVVKKDDFFGSANELKVVVDDGFINDSSSDLFTKLLQRTNSAFYNFDPTKRRSLGDSHYTNLVCDLNTRNLTNLKKDYQLLKEAEFSGITKHSSVLTYTHLDQLIVPSKADVTQDQLYKAYDKVERNRTNGLLNALKAFEPTNQDIDFDFIGVQVASARPWLGFYNSMADLLMLKYMHDFPNGGLVKIGYLGAGGHGKTQSLTINNFIHRFNQSSFDLNNWYHDAETQGIIRTSANVFKELFYNSWVGVGTLKSYENESLLDKRDFLLNPERVFRVAASLTPSSFFNIDLSEFHEQPDKGFYPSTTPCVRKTRHYLEVANEWINNCQSINSFENYFGISGEFINNLLKISDREALVYTLEKALFLDVDVINQALNRIL